MTQIQVYHSVGGHDVKKSDQKKGEKIARQFNAECIWISDKTACLEISDERGFRNAMQVAGLDWLIANY